MAVQIDNAQTAQDLMQLSQAQPARVRARANRAGGFPELLDAPLREIPKLPEEPDGGNLSAFINHFIQGVEQLKQLAEELGDLDAAEESGTDASAGRFDPDRILAADFADGLQEKRLLDFLTDPESSPEEIGDGEKRGGEAFFAAPLSQEDLAPGGGAEGLREMSPAAINGPGAAHERRVRDAAARLGHSSRDGAGGLPPEDAENSAEPPDKPARAFGGELSHEDLSDGSGADAEDENKGDWAARRKIFPAASPADKQARIPEASRLQRGDRAQVVPDSDRDKINAKNTPEYDPLSSLRAPLSRAAEEPPALRPSETPALGQPGGWYSLNPDDAFGDGITTVLLFLRGEGIREARIVVEPPALGRVDISLQATASGMEAAFKVDNEDLKQLLQQQLDSLKNALQSQGIHVSEMTVDIKNRGDQRRQNAQGADRKARRLEGIEGGEEEEAETKLIRLDLEKSLLHWIA